MRLFRRFQKPGAHRMEGTLMGFLNRHFPHLNATASMLYRSLRMYAWNRSPRAWGVLLSHLCRRAIGRPGAYEKSLEGIKNLRQFNVPCEILTYASKRNVTSGLERIIALGRQLGVQSVYVFFPVAVGRWDGEFDKVLNEEEKARLRELHDLTFAHVEIPTSRTMCCVLQRSVLYVSPIGEVTPCPFIPYAMGNIRRHTLSELWQSYCAGLDTSRRGECVMNEPQARQALKRHVDSVARSLR